MNNHKSYLCTKHGDGENPGGRCCQCDTEAEDRRASELALFRETPGNRSELRVRLRAALKRIDELDRSLSNAGELYAIALDTIERSRAGELRCVGCEHERVVGAKASAECLTCGRSVEDRYQAKGKSTDEVLDLLGLRSQLDHANAKIRELEGTICRAQRWIDETTESFAKLHAEQSGKRSLEANALRYGADLVSATLAILAKEMETKQ